MGLTESPAVRHCSGRCARTWTSIPYKLQHNKCYQQQQPTQQHEQLDTRHISHITTFGTCKLASDRCCYLPCMRSYSTRRAWWLPRAPFIIGFSGRFRCWCSAWPLRMAPPPLTTMPREATTLRIYLTPLHSPISLPYPQQPQKLAQHPIYHSIQPPSTLTYHLRMPSSSPRSLSLRHHCLRHLRHRLRRSTLRRSNT